MRNRDRLIGIGEPVLPRYERIVFEKDLISPQGQPLAAFVCPGHPLLDATIDLTLERHRDLLRRGAILIDERDSGTQLRVLFYLEHAIQDASQTRSGERRMVSKQLLYVEIDVPVRPSIFTMPLISITGLLKPKNLVLKLFYPGRNATGSDMAWNSRRWAML